MTVLTALTTCAHPAYARCSVPDSSVAVAVRLAGLEAAPGGDRAQLGEGVVGVAGGQGRVAAADRVGLLDAENALPHVAVEAGGAVVGIGAGGEQPRDAVQRAEAVVDAGGDSLGKTNL